MSTITKEFTKEQLIEQAKKNIEVLRGAVERIPGASDAAVIHLKLAEITLASLEAEPVCYLTWHQGFRAPDDCEEYVVEAKPGDKSCDGTPAFPVYSAPPAPANAEPVAWLWSHRKHPSEVSLVRPEDDERAEGAHWSGWSCQALYAAQPASAAMKDHQIRELVNELRDIAVEYHGTQQLRERIARTIRAAMLHGADGNSPVIPDGWVMVQVEPTEDMIVHGFESEPDESFSDEKEWEAYDAMSGCQQAAHRAKLCWAAMIAAAPKPDVR